VHVKFNRDDVKINSVKGSRFKLHIPVEIENPTAKALFLKKTQIDVLKIGYNFAKVELNEKIEIPANSNEKYIITLDGKIVDAMSAIFSNFNFKNTQSEIYTFSGFVKAGTKTFSKKIKFKNSNFEALLNSFGN
jgi:LEA14-like dessication related protein